MYGHQPEVASIHAHVFPSTLPLPETFFIRRADCWGWATWTRAWQHFNPDSQYLLGELEGRNLSREFDLDGSYPFSQMLRDQIAGRDNSWAIRWHPSTFLRNMVISHPGRTMVLNFGTEGSGIIAILHEPWMLF